MEYSWARRFWRSAGVRAIPGAGWPRRRVGTGVPGNGPASPLGPPARNEMNWSIWPVGIARDSGLAGSSSPSAPVTGRCINRGLFTPRSVRGSVVAYAQDVDAHLPEKVRIALSLGGASTPGEDRRLPAGRTGGVLLANANRHSRRPVRARSGPEFPPAAPRSHPGWRTAGIRRRRAAHTASPLLVFTLS